MCRYEVTVTVVGGVKVCLPDQLQQTVDAIFAVVDSGRGRLTVPGEVPGVVLHIPVTAVACIAVRRMDGGAGHGG